MKQKNKVARLEARQKAFDGTRADIRRSRHMMHRPGSLKK
jgi:hypothetical protein